MGPRVATALVLGLWALAAAAETGLTVLYDSGATRPLAPLLEVLTDVTPAMPPAPPAPEPAPTRTLGAADLGARLPIRSPGFSPGPVAPRAEPRPFARPFFLIGADPRSRAWLAQRRERLLALGAVGMLVEAETVEDVEAIAALAGGLPILPAPASDIAAALGLTHYPVLITPEGIAP